ncbi:restriction endonuclease subunit S [Psychrobacillus sp. Sa2BUA9]|uniref:Restriction endonuclease subunit S n=1 Tax=Psychrobacillus faecigallinarum TaxID=2762235 RepID=A0ABR8RD76_9BACI|nr:restriction endonuclease subunit S [Psychrobacillus faecigallinarum]MBD7945689.1 restriction endonuclease subunit S [Psychrobacillus faecigallinarum]
MSFNLTEYELNELVEIKYGKNQKKVESGLGSYPILGTGGVMGYATEYLYDKPSVLIGRKGSISKVKYINEPFWTVDTLFYTKVNENVVIPKYLYYVLSQIDFNYYNEGTTIPSLRTETLKKIKLQLPSLNLQQKIVFFLDRFEEKIKLNNSLIKKLEIVSSYLFKSWFIDFEFPNKQGLPYRSSGGKMKVSELGEIPVEWNIVELKTLTTLLKKTFNPQKTELEEVVHFSLPAFDAKNYPVIDKVVDIKSNKWIVEENCLLFSKMNPITPRIWVPKVNEEYLNVASSEFVVLRNENFKETALIYTLCKSEPFIEYLRANATGSTNSRQRITPDNAMLYKLPIDLVVVNDFSVIVSPLIEQIQELYEEINKLELLRATLLPKLLSGEIEIPDESVVD